MCYSNYSYNILNNNLSYTVIVSIFYLERIKMYIIIMYFYFMSTYIIFKELLYIDINLNNRIPYLKDINLALLVKS